MTPALDGSREDLGAFRSLPSLLAQRVRDTCPARLPPASRPSVTAPGGLGVPSVSPGRPRKRSDSVVAGPPLAGRRARASLSERRLCPWTPRRQARKPSEPPLEATCEALAWAATVLVPRHSPSPPAATRWTPPGWEAFLPPCLPRGSEGHMRLLPEPSTPSWGPPEAPPVTQPEAPNRAGCAVRTLGRAACPCTSLGPAACRLLQPPQAARQGFAKQVFRV